MMLRKILLAVLFASLTALPLMAQRGQRNPARTTPVPAPATTGSASQVTANRIYRALLGRDADAVGLTDTATDIERGRTRQRIDAIVGGTEFRNHVRGMQSTQIVTQVYQGLLQRDPDFPGATSWQRLMEQGRYSDAVLGIMDSAEFQNKIAASSSNNANVPGGSRSSTAPATVDATGAVTCEENVVEAIRNDLRGFVFLQFDTPAINGSAITGSATDVADGGRRLTFRCDGGTSYSYSDGRRDRSAPTEGEFSSDVVRSCQGEIRTKVQQQRGAASVVFESAGLMPYNGDTKMVRGLGFERSRTGANGANFLYSCEMRGTQILVSSFRGR